MSLSKQCITCGKHGGIFTCNGCERAFCGKHAQEHRQELANQLDGVVQEHDLIHEELTRSLDVHDLFEKINQWEQETITKIQVTAEVLRVDLREMIDKSKERIVQACEEIALNLRSAREVDDFCEEDLQRWTQQLNELKSEIISPSTIQLIEDDQSVIRLITIREKDIIDHRTISQNRSSYEERFSTVIGSAALKEDGLVVVNTNHLDGMVYILGRKLYFHGQETVRLRIEYSRAPYNVFIGCISSEVMENDVSFRSSSVVGWFGNNQTCKHGIIDSNSINHGYHSGHITINDVLCVTFNCLHRQLEFFHERLNKRHIIPVDIAQTTFPWKLLVILPNVGDSVRILS